MPAQSQMFDSLLKAVRQGFRERKPQDQPRDSISIQQLLDSVMDAYRRGDYEAAGKIAEGFREIGEESAYTFYRGSMLMHLGRFQEAEPLQRRNVLLQSQPQLSALSYSMLGQNLQEQGQYEEAMDCFEAALRRWPAKGSIHRHMAELHLRRRDCPTEALKWANLAVDEERSLNSDAAQARPVDRANLGLALTTLAWAIAVANRNSAKVEMLLAEAVTLLGTDSVPLAAQAHYHAGQALAALGETGRSRQHFEEAARLDGNGIWGRAASSVLQGK